MERKTGEINKFTKEKLRIFFIVREPRSERDRRGRGRDMYPWRIVCVFERKKDRQTDRQGNRERSLRTLDV